MEAYQYFKTSILISYFHAMEQTTPLGMVVLKASLKDYPERRRKSYKCKSQFKQEVKITSAKNFKKWGDR